MEVDTFEKNTHSFIVKIWLEETADEADQATWYGYITHVASGKRRYLKHLEEILSFLTPYLEELGIEVKKPSASKWQRFWHRLVRRSSRDKRNVNL